MTDAGASPETDQHRDDLSRSFIDVIRALDDSAGDDGLTVGEMVDRMDERAFGLLILILAIPCLVPGLPGAQIIAIPIFLLALQMMIGRSEPWLPGWFLRVRVRKPWMRGVADFADKRLRWTERLARPRLRFVATGLGEKLASLIIALAAVTIMLPITNTIPSLAITVMAIGILQRDGVFTGLGGLLALAWITLLAGIVAGVLMGLEFAVAFVDERLPFLADLLGR
jgi:hypothetical protein